MNNFPNSVPYPPKKTNSVFLPILVISLVIAALIVVIGYVDPKGDDDTDDGEKTVVSEQETMQTVTEPLITVPQETQEAPTMPPETQPAPTLPPETQPAPTLPPETQPAPVPETYSASGVAVYPVQNNRSIFANGYYSIENTPSGAGVVLRQYSYPTSEKLCVIGEHELVRSVCGYSSLDNGYVWVTYDKDGSGTTMSGWVLAQYMYPANPFVNERVAPEQYRTGMRARVSFDTPFDAGINMRIAPEVPSQIVCTIDEGMIVDIVRDYDEFGEWASGYIMVGIDYPGAGEYYEGFALVEYLEYYGWQ